MIYSRKWQIQLGSAKPHSDAPFSTLNKWKDRKLKKPKKNNRNVKQFIQMNKSYWIENEHLKMIDWKMFTVKQIQVRKLTTNGSCYENYVNTINVFLTRLDLEVSMYNDRKTFCLLFWRLWISGKRIWFLWVLFSFFVWFSLFFWFFFGASNAHRRVCTMCFW